MEAPVLGGTGGGFKEVVSEIRVFTCRRGGTTGRGGARLGDRGEVLIAGIDLLMDITQRTTRAFFSTILTDGALASLVF